MFFVTSRLFCVEQQRLNKAAFVESRAAVLHTCNTAARLLTKAALCFCDLSGVFVLNNSG